LRHWPEDSDAIIRATGNLEAVEREGRLRGSRSWRGEQPACTRDRSPPPEIANET